MKKWLEKTINLKRVEKFKILTGLKNRRLEVSDDVLKRWLLEIDYKKIFYNILFLEFLKL